MKSKRTKKSPTPRIALGLNRRRILALAKTKEAQAVQREISELREVLKEQSEHLNTLTATVEDLANRDTSLRTMLLEEHNRLLSRDDEIQSTLYDLRVALAGASLQNGTDVGGTTKDHVSNEDVRYLQLIRRIREVVRGALPAGSIVVVVSRGDDELLDLYGRRGWHFPQDEEGAYPGHYPAGSTAAIAQLESLRARGAEFLLLPATAFWWLEHYGGFRRHLEERYEVVAEREDACLLFDLREPVASKDTTWWTTFEEMNAQFYDRFGREPAILDWNTGLEWAARFPNHAVFSPPTMDDTLPYLDRSVDIVTVSSVDSSVINEARRVAAVAVAIPRFKRDTVQPGTELEVEWKLEVGATPPPTVSIVIPSYNGIAYTEALLVTLRETLPPDFRGEIIVVDDASTDDTQARLKVLTKQDKRLRVLRNRKNSGFIVTCNRGAKAAKGEIVILFNNDTLALPGWLPPLLRIFRDYPDAGAVGGKLVFPDGRLQDAGGVVFSDGSAANFGKWDYEVDAPLYNYVREVDYVTGAFIATKRSLFVESGGFDTRFRPIYYEETDYCFRLREMGYQVYYQPESVIVHLEGATSGTDLSTGLKQYQVANHIKFVEKWKRVLERQPPNPNGFDFATWCALAPRDESGDDGEL